MQTNERKKESKVDHNYTSATEGFRLASVNCRMQMCQLVPNIAFGTACPAHEVGEREREINAPPKESVWFRSAFF